MNKSQQSGENFRQAVEALVVAVLYQDGQLISASYEKEIIDLTLSHRKIMLKPGSFGIVMDTLTRPRSRYNGKIPDSNQAEAVDRITSFLISRQKNYYCYIALPFRMPEGLVVGLHENGEYEDGADIITIHEHEHEKIINANQLTDLSPVQRDLFPPEDKGMPTTTEIENTPQFDTPRLDDLAYLKVRTKGVAVFQYLSVSDIDPIHIWKIVIARLNVAKILVDSDMLPYLSKLGEKSHIGDLLVYEQDTMRYSATLRRPSGEVEFVKKLEASSKDPIEENTANELRGLIEPRTNTYMESERLKIINSLYWYFEARSATNPAFQTLMLVSMFDSFYDESVARQSKVTAILSTAGKKTSGREKDAIDSLYQKRNKIAHGQIHLLDVHESRGGHLLSKQMLDRLYDLYGDYINEKIRLYIE